MAGGVVENMAGKVRYSTSIGTDIACLDIEVWREASRKKYGRKRRGV
jgi:hypothetical protein